ncbi:hypothetical protein rosmuc_02923 [Roseovarius mucosus DSM 17069]|uniref:Lipoprotein n=1 Tax=Roseovarius mucosus DSM 17069 TaxID=1288298 RepID=A0A0A0HHL3_9RHOB|nr:hypothetical protein [Roseovarius mucosus]KGM86630.1 hypothetical protein rosmuc_02923 [Roseovarius mucosus DSM 17069]
MKLLTFLSTLAVIALVGCGQSTSPEQRAQIAKNKATNDAIWKTRKTTTVNGVPYEVAVSPDRSYALVAPAGSKIWIMSDMVTAVNNVSGCKGQPDFLLSMMAGGNLSQPIDMTKVKTNIDQMRSDLKC